MGQGKITLLIDRNNGQTMLKALKQRRIIDNRYLTPYIIEQALGIEYLSIYSFIY